MNTSMSLPPGPPDVSNGVPAPKMRRLERRPRRSREGARQHRRNIRVIEVVLAVGLPGSILLLWQLAATWGWIDNRIYPKPTKIVRTLVDIAADGDLHQYVLTSLRLILIGFGFGAVTGFAMGLLTGVSSMSRAALEPTFNALYVVPKLAILPVFLTIFGFGNMPIIALIGVTVFFFVWIQIMEAVANVDEGYRDAARSFGANRRQLFVHVLLPAVVPQLFVALRISVGVAVLVSVAAEFVVGSTGLGTLIFRSNQLFIIDRVYVGIVVVSVLGVVLQALISATGHALTPWTRARR